MSIPKETSAPVAKSASAKKMLMGDLMQTVGILPILILIVAVFGFIAPNFFTESNLLNITRQASINIVLAAGMTFIILTGGIDLSVGSILGTTAVAAMVVSLIPAFALLSIPAALMLGLLLGLFNGALVAFAGLPPFIVTLGTYTALRGAAYLLADGTRAQAITASPAAYIERMKQEGWQAQLVTGFAIGETDAVYARSGENAMLCAKDGETVYMIIAQADEQTLYALGVDAETK